MPNHVDTRLASMHNALRECADFISELRRDRDKANLLAADQELVIKRLRDVTSVLRAENEQLRQMVQWMNTGNREDAA
jgi:hypothetical protein